MKNQDMDMVLRFERAMTAIEGLSETVKIYIERHDADQNRIEFFKREAEKSERYRQEASAEVARLRGQIASLEAKGRRRK